MTNLVGVSSLIADGAGLALELETGVGLTPMGQIEHPNFFSGLVARPEIAAAGILTVADVATTTYLDLAALAASRDPVVTASGDRLRFESFSGCNGVHARFDLLEDGIDSGEVGFGTTNVDINQPLRSALAALPRKELMHVTVGPESLKVSTPEDTHEERKVELPPRWVRGFAEVPMLLASMRHTFEVGGAQAMTFLAGLPRGAPGPAVGVLGTPRGPRLVAAGSRDSVTLAGTARLTTLRRVMRHIRRLTAWSHESGASAWVADLDGARITLVLTPQPYRGFSGEGSLLNSLSQATNSGPALRLLEHLAWEPKLDAAALALDTGLTREEVEAGTAVLAASGKVGFDLTDGAFFHREIPYDTEAVERDHPRLRAARALLADGSVQRGDTAGEFRVGTTGREHWVRLGDDATCTCRWMTRYGGGRGPCSHILAAQLVHEEPRTS